ncbi:MAG: YncE family protein [Acidobacteriia bacterium]|nr:YncE family protein [Terriglobia bacterium]
MKRFLWLGCVLFLYLICTGCGDTFRPIIIPNPPQFPNPKASHTVVSINDNGTAVPGSTMVIDVSGDTDVSVKDVGVAPVHAAQQAANQVLVVNHSVPGQQNTVDSLTKLTFNGTVISSATTISLPTGSEADFVAVAPLDTTAYVTLSSLNAVAVVSTTSNNQVATIPVGNTPYAMAVTPDKSKLYVANEGDNTISGFNTVDRSARVGSPATTSSAPIWLVPRTDNQRVYVLEQNGTLAWLDTTSTAGPDPLTETAISVPNATTMTYDPNKNRLYIAGGNPGEPQVAIVDVSQSAPVLLKTISIPPFTLLNLSSVPAIAAAAAALPDASRAYLASYATLPSQFTVSSVMGDGTTATYAYTLTSGHDLTPGVSVTVTGTQQNGFDGTFVIGAIVSGTTACPGTCFQVPNLTTLSSMSVTASGTGSNIFPQVTVVDVASNTIKSTFGIPGFPDATVVGSPYYVSACVAPTTFPAPTTFRFMMAAGGDSSRAYLSSCDGGNVNIIDTSVDNYILNLPAPVGSRAPIPPSQLNPPQNPMFLIAGP